MIKKTKKMLLIGAVLVVMALGLCGCAGVKTNEQAGAVAPTSASVFFNEKVLPLVIQYGTVAVGVLSVVVPILGKINKSRKTFDAANMAMQAVETDSAIVKENVKKKDNEIAVLNRQLSGEIQELKKQIQSMTTSTNAILKICEIAFTNNKDLVINGYASDIKKVVDNEKNKEEN